MWGGGDLQFIIQNNIKPYFIFNVFFVAIILTFPEFQGKLTISIPFFSLQNRKIPRLPSNRRNTASICFYHTMKTVKTPRRAL